MKNGILKYNDINERYGLSINGEWKNNGLHCGEALEVQVKNQWIQTRIEMDMDTKEWYLVGTSFSGNLENIIARM